MFAQSDMPKKGENRGQRPHQVFEPDQHRVHEAGNQVTRGDPPGTEIGQPGHQFERFDPEAGVTAFEAMPIADKHHPGERLVGIHHGIVLNERPFPQVVLVRFVVKVPEKEPEVSVTKDSEDTKKKKGELIQIESKEVQR